jgi:hypothetical protein
MPNAFAEKSPTSRENANAGCGGFANREMFQLCRFSPGCPAQHSDVPVCPERSAWTGGHGTEPCEQNTQQSPAFGRSVTPHPVHV